MERLIWSTSLYLTFGGVSHTKMRGCKLEKPTAAKVAVCALNKTEKM